MENPKKDVTEGEEKNESLKEKMNHTKRSTSEEMNSKRVKRFQVIHSSQQKGRKVSYTKYAIATHLLKRKGGKA